MFWQYEEEEEDSIVSLLTLSATARCGVEDSRTGLMIILFIPAPIRRQQET